MRRRRGRRLLLLLLIAAGLLGRPEWALAERLAVKQYTTADGLPHNRVNCIVQDSHGFVWLCTAQGLSRFDGYAFTTYTSRDGLPSPYVNQFLETGDGEYWVATSAGVCRFIASTSRCQVYKLGDDLLNNRAVLLYRDRSGQLWAGTAGDLFHLDLRAPSPVFVRVPLGSERGIRAMAEDAGGSLWIATPVGLWQRLADGRLRKRVLGGEHDPDGAGALLADADGRLWIGHRSGLIVLKPIQTDAPAVLRDVPASGTIELPNAPGEAYRFRGIAGASGLFVPALHQSPHGPIWIGTSDSGLVRFEAGRFYRLPAPRGLSVFGAIALTSDREGNLWIATVADGALRVARHSFVTYDESEGLPADGILSLFEDRSGAPIVVTAAGLTYRFDGERFTAVRPNLPANFTGNVSQSGPLALQDRDGDWWFRSQDALFRFTVRRFDDLAHAAPRARYTTRDGLSYGRFSRMRVFEDSRGDIWVGALNGDEGSLTRWDRATKTFQRCPLPPRTQTSPAAFGEDLAGHLWVGLAQGGLARCRPNGCEAIDLGGMPAGPVHGFYVEASGRLWFAADRAGLGRIDDPTATHPAIVAYGAAHGLAGNVVNSVSGDRWGRVYAGSENGVDRLDPATGRVKHFTTADGLAQNEQRIAFRDRRGTLWFGTVRGLSSLVPQPDVPGGPPSVRISGVRIAGTPQPLSALGETVVPHVELAPARNQLQVDFASVGFAPGEVLRYQYRLAGVDADWSRPASERTVTYAALPPGAYQFLVRAINADGLTSPQPAAVMFRVFAPFWRQWWFVSLCGATLGLAAFGLHRYRVRHLIELERVRTRIASDLHDDIGASLSQIAILGEVVRARIGLSDTAVEEPLARIGSLSRESVDSMSDIVWAIDPHKDRLENLAQRMRRLASDVLAVNGIDFSFEASEERLALGADVRREVFLAFKEILNNAVRHAACRRVEIMLRTDGPWLVLVVRDDGRGFDAHAERSGHGLKSLRRRAAALGGSIEIAATAGTQVTLRIPYRPRRTHVVR